MAITLSIVPTTKTVSQRTAASYEVTVEDGRATLGVSGLPEGVTPVFDANPIGPDASTTLTIPTSALEVGTHSLRLTGEEFIEDAIYAASASLADVRAAIDAARPGDTVMVPEGSATWTEQLVIRKGINLIGAGIGKTIITNGRMGTGWNNSLIEYNPSDPSANEPFRFSGFEINGGGDGTYKNPDTYDLVQCLKISNPSNTQFITNIRVDNNKVYNFGKANWFSIVGHIAGVMHNNIIGTVENDGLNQAARFFFGARSQFTWQNMTYHYAQANQFFVEDNVIVSPVYVLHSYYGAVFTVRHNTFYHPRNYGAYPYLDMHGNFNSPGMTSVMGCVFHDNQIICSFNHSATFMDQRGGMFLAYNNTMTTTNVVEIQVREEHHDSGAPPATGPGGQPQHVYESYYFNTFNGAGTRMTHRVPQTVDYGGAKGIVPQENRDFFNHVVPFNGSSGVGVGLRADRPVSCTREGVGYWATDEKRLYRWRNWAWELYYTPYTYPHPLRT